MQRRSRGTVLEEYWDWVAVALFLLLTVDMLTTMAAAAVVGPEAEANPLMQWALHEGPITLIVIHLVALVVLVVLFYGLRETIIVAEPPLDRYVAVLAEIFLGLLIAVGLAVFANNLSVIVLGESLL